MKKFVRVVCVGLLLAGFGTLAYGGNATSATKLRLTAFKAMVELEPTREGPLHDLVRGSSVIIPNPINSNQCATEGRYICRIL